MLTSLKQCTSCVNVFFPSNLNVNLRRILFWKCV